MIDKSTEVQAPPVEQSEDRGRARATIWEALAVAAILLFAATVRLVSINTLPPGLFQDEAVYLVDSESILYGPPQIYYGEREPLYMYVVAGASLILGASPLTLRITAALFSLAEVAAGGALARQLFGRKVGLIAAAGLASSLWLTALGRTGFRAISLPAVECLGLAVLWHATRTGRKAEYALGGAVLGLSLYTYLNSRFLPFALFAFVAIVAAFDRPWLTKRLRGLFLAGLTAFVVCLPLGFYGYRHPEIFFGRPDQVALPGGAAFLPALIDSSLRTLGEITFRGDPTWRHNLSGAPVLDPLNALLFVVGLGVVLWRRGTASLYVVVMLAVMLLPGMFSIDSPHFLRTDGAVGPIYIVWAVGVSVVAAWLPRVVRSRSARATLAGISVGLPLVVAGGRDVWGYFVTYANSPDMPAAYNVELAAAGRVLAQSALWRSSRANVYLSDAFEQDRTSVTAFLYPLLTPSERARWLDADIPGTFISQDELIPLPVAPSLYVLSDDPSQIHDALGTMIQRQTRIAVGGGKSIVLVDAAPVAASVAPGYVDSGPIQFGGLLTLEGAEVETSTESDPATPTIVLRWRVDGQPAYQPSIFLHVDDAQHRTVAQSDLEVKLSRGQWRVGQEWITYHRPNLPAGTPPGQYTIDVGVYDKSTGARETALIAGRPVVTTAVTSVELTAPVPGVAAAERPLDQPIAPELTLTGVDALPAHVEAGATVPVTLVWQATASALVDYDLIVTLRTAGGESAGAWRGPVGAAAYPTSRWVKGAYLRQTIEVPTVPTSSGPATVSIQVVPAGGGSTGSAGLSTALGSVVVDPAQHTFGPPTPTHPLDIGFGTFGRLVGYAGPAGSTPAGGNAALTLYWQATGPSPTAYTVFVHLLDAQDHIVGQRDEPPVHGTRPTTGWVPNEYVTDSHALTVDPSTPSGTYRIEVGLYDPVTGARVQTSDGADRAIIGSMGIQAK